MEVLELGVSLMALESAATLEDLELGVLLMALETAATLEDLEWEALVEDLGMAWRARLQGRSRRSGGSILSNLW